MVDINHLKKDVIDSKNAEYIYYLALRKNELVKELTDALIGTDNPEYIFYFAKNVKGADKEKLTNALIAIESFPYLCAITQFIEGELLEKVLEELCNILALNKKQDLFLVQKNMEPAAYFGLLNLFAERMQTATPIIDFDRSR